MKKTLFFTIFAVIALFVMATSVQATGILTELQAELTTTGTLTELQAELTATGTTEVDLTQSITVTDADGNVTLDLNGKTLNLNFDDSALVPKGGIKVDGGNLTITNGKIETATVGHMIMVTNGGYLKLEDVTLTSSKSGGSAIVARGAASDADAKTSVIAKDSVEINADYGITVFGQKNADKNAYDVVVDFYGTINSGVSGITISGNASQTEGDVPEIYIYDDANIISNGVGIYAAGYGIWDIDAANISGKGSGLGIKSGEITLNNTNVTADGDYAVPTGNGSGITGTGAAVQIEAYKNYAGKIELTINGGTYTSKNNSAILEYTTSTAEHTFIEKISVTDGEFTSADGVESIVVSESFKEEILETTGGFVQGGTFSSDVDEYVADGLETSTDEDGNIYVGTLNSIVITTPVNGTLSVSATTAVKGQPIKVTVNAAEGFTIDSIKLYDSQNNLLDVEIVDNVFTMIDEDVTVEATFKSTASEDDTNDDEKDENNEEDKDNIKDEDNEEDKDSIKDESNEEDKDSVKDESNEEDKDSVKDENNEENEDEEGKDSTPTTGVKSIALPIFVTLAVISLAGLVINRKRK